MTNNGKSIPTDYVDPLGFITLVRCDESTYIVRRDGVPIGNVTIFHRWCGGDKFKVTLGYTAQEKNRTAIFKRLDHAVLYAAIRTTTI